MSIQKYHQLFFLRMRVLLHFQTYKSDWRVRGANDNPFMSPEQMKTHLIQHFYLL